MDATACDKGNQAKKKKNWLPDRETGLFAVRFQKIKTLCKTCAGLEAKEAAARGEALTTR